MARKIERNKALLLRRQGMSYSQIKESLGISKSTLSGWLSNMPLSESRIRELRDNSQIRIEKTRETKRLKKETRRNGVLAKVARDIESSKDPCFVSGFYLYWGEGTKSAEYTVALTNSDPAMIHCFVEWLIQLGVSRDGLKVKLHLYSDQEEKQLVKFWAGVTSIPRKNFYKSYIKQTSSDRKTYKGLFPYGTCAVFYSDRDIYEYVLGGVKYLRNKYSLPSSTI